MSTTFTSRRDILDVPLLLDRSVGNQPRQVHAGLRAAILDGRLPAGVRMPSSRALAEQTGLRRNTVVVAYEYLLSDGLVEARPGSGTYVTTRLPARTDASGGAPFAIDPLRRGPFALGQTHPDPDILAKLARATKRRIANASGADLAYGDPRGCRDLREQIASHLATSRGISCDPDHVLIVNGMQQGLRLCADALLETGDAVWVEDPGYPASRRTLQAAGLRTIPVPVDADGIDIVAGLQRPGVPKAAYVTPSSQFPTGATMSMERRAALLDWARASNAWIFEDDYFNEFRYEGPSLSALAGLGGADRVVYLGTFSKTLFAGLRLAYLVLPHEAMRRVIDKRATHDRCPPTFLGGAVADLMADGTLASHVRRMRKRYRLARDAVAEAFRSTAGEALQVIVPDQGLHIVAKLPSGTPRDVAEQIKEAVDFEAMMLGDTYLSDVGCEGFILGFSGHGTADMIACATRISTLARALVLPGIRTRVASPS